MMNGISSRNQRLDTLQDQTFFHRKDLAFQECQRSHQECLGFQSEGRSLLLVELKLI